MIFFQEFSKEKNLRIFQRVLVKDKTGIFVKDQMSILKKIFLKDFVKERKT